LCQKLLKFSRKVDECKPLRGGRGGGSIAATEVEVAALNGDDDADDGEFNPGRGLHSSTSQLNLSRV